VGTQEIRWVPEMEEKNMKKKINTRITTVNPNQQLIENFILHNLDKLSYADFKGVENLGIYYSRHEYEDCYDEHPTPAFVITGTREETDKEYAERLEQEERNRKRDLAELERLQNLYKK
jgi:hypothetical protein